MATTVTNTTFIFLCMCLIALLIRYARHGENQASAWLRNAIQFASGSKLILSVLVLGGAIGVGGHVLVGYLGSGDLFQDFVAAKEFAAGRSMNPPNMPERVQYWLGQEKLESTFLAHWAPLRRLQAGAIENMKGTVTVQGHPPFHILLITPIVELCGSIQVFYVVTAVMNVASYALLLWLLWRGTKLSAIIPASAIALLCLLALDWQPLLANLRQGQIHMLVAFLVVAGWFCLLRDRPWFAGILIGLAALIKMFPALLFVWLLLRKRTAFVAALATVFIVVLTVYLFRGPGAFIDYFHTMKAYEQQFGQGRQNYALASVIPYLIVGPSAKSLLTSAVVLFADVALFGYTAYLTLRKPAPTGLDATLEFSGYVVLSCLLSPTVEAFYYPMLLLPMAAIASVIRPSSLLRGSICLLGILWCFSPPEQVVWRPMQFFAPMIGDRLSFLLFSFPTFGMLALWYWITSRQAAAANSKAAIN